MEYPIVVLVFTILIHSSVTFNDHETCENTDEKILTSSEILQPKKFLLYDVNPGEGFNLRRDVYIRVANLVRRLRSSGDDWTLVLPPWGPIYHWKTTFDEKRLNQRKIPWSHFFDLQSLAYFIPVIELTDFLNDTHHIDVIYILQYFADTFKEGNKWADKYELNDCISKPLYRFQKKNEVRGWFWGFNENLFALNYSCLSLQGQASLLLPLLQSNFFKSIMLDRAEIMLHDSYGDADYWMARRSMKYSSKLIEIGNRFRAKHLTSSDEFDKTETPNDWRYFRKNKGEALGGPYIGVHLRRGDFVHGRNQTVPNLKNAANQINKAMKLLKLSIAFISSDATKSEFKELKKWLPTAIRYVPKKEELMEVLDGGVAIIDQWICAHARYFIGTSESTFSFRIQEDREILGFNPDSTFNRLCGDPEGEICDQPTRWKIVY